MFEKAFVDDPTDGERPVRFGFFPEEREYLKKERSVEEIMSFIREKKLGTAITDAEFNNCVGFGWFPAQGEILRQSNGCVFRMNSHAKDGYEDFSIGCMSDEEWADYQRSKKKARYAVVFITEGDETQVQVLMSTDPPDYDRACFTDPLDNAVAEILLRHAGIDTYHKLGKLINRARKIADEEKEAREKYTIPRGVYR